MGLRRNRLSISRTVNDTRTSTNVVRSIGHDANASTLQVVRDVIVLPGENEGRTATCINGCCAQIRVVLIVAVSVKRIISVFASAHIRGGDDFPA